VEAFAKPYPSLTIATVMGAALSDAPRLHEWSNWIQRQFDGPSLMTERERIEQAVAEFYDYAGELLARRRRGPGDDLISTLIAARFEGDKLSDAELVNLVLNVLVGGVDTTQSQLAQGIGCSPSTPNSGTWCGQTPWRWSRARSRSILRYGADHAVHRAHRRGGLVYRDVVFPGRHRGDGMRLPPATASRTSPTSSTSRRARGQAADLRRGHPLLPGGRTSPRRAAGGAGLSSPRPVEAHRARRRARDGLDQRDLRDRRAADPLDG
jgi:hypothetical protein